MKKVFVLVIVSLYLLGLSTIGFANNGDLIENRHSVLVFPAKMIYDDEEMREKLQNDLKEKFPSSRYHMYIFFPDNSSEMPVEELNLRETLRDGYSKDRTLFPTKEMLIEYGKDSNSDKVTIITVYQNGSSTQVKRFLGSFFARKIQVEAKTLDVKSEKYVYVYSAMNEEPKKTKEAFEIAMSLFLEKVSLP